MNILDKIGSLGAVFGGLGLSCCLPLFAAVSSAVGFGFLARYEPQMNLLMQAAVLVAVAGTFLAYRKHKNLAPLILSIVSAAMILYAVNTDLNANLIYGGLVGLLGTVVLNAIFTRRCGSCDAAGVLK